MQRFIQKTKNVYHFFNSLLANCIFGFTGRKIKTIGVTGTDGKTTVVNLIYEILTKGGLKAGMISTVGARVLERKKDIGFHTTTPSPFFIQRFFCDLIDKGGRYAVIEVTSHAIDQFRVYGLPFEIGVLTNLAREHLDYHGSLKEYIETKAKLLKKAKVVLLNKDDESYTKVKRLLKDKKIITYGKTEKADYRIKNVRTNLEKSSFFIVYGRKGRKKEVLVKTEAIGDFNVLNITAGFIVGRELKVKEDDILKAIREFRLPKGRLEVVIRSPFEVVVDFAHTPNAFLSILPFLKKNCKGKLIHVFGATGDRDKGKRPVMGKVSGEIADLCVLTSEDSYSEEPRKIIKDIERGMLKTGKVIDKDFFIVADRKEAIHFGLGLAKKDDLVVITGVGHQVSLNVKGKEVPWSEREAVLSYFKK